MSQNKNFIKNKSYQKLFRQIDNLIIQHQQNVFDTIYKILTELYWQIGKMIITYLQENEQRAPYREKIIQQLSIDLTASGKKGYSVVNLKNMRLFYQVYPEKQTLRLGITWS